MKSYTLKICTQFLMFPKLPYNQKPSSNFCNCTKFCIVLHSVYLNSELVQNPQTLFLTADFGAWVWQQL